MGKKSLKSLLEAEIILSFNSKRGKMKGLQTFGVNEAVIVRGGQFGATNYAEDVKGFQISCFFNIAGTLKGFQGGVFNGSCLEKGLQAGVISCAFDFEDIGQEYVMQISGFNMVKNANRAYQFGLVNLGETDNGLQIGLMNFIGTENGYQIGLLNMSEGYTAQTGVINISHKGTENQSGLLNIILDGKKSWQFGAINIIKSNPWFMRVLPAVNYSIPKELWIEKREQRLKNEITKIKKTAKEEGNNGVVYARF